MSGSSLARALLALAALGLVACAGGPHGPDELVLVPVPLAQGLPYEPLSYQTIRARLLGNAEWGAAPAQGAAA